MDRRHGHGIQAGRAGSNCMGEGRTGREYGQGVPAGSTSRKSGPRRRQKRPAKRKRPLKMYVCSLPVCRLFFLFLSLSPSLSPPPPQDVRREGGTAAVSLGPSLTFPESHYPTGQLLPEGHAERRRRPGASMRTGDDSESPAPRSTRRTSCSTAPRTGCSTAPRISCST